MDYQLLHKMKLIVNSNSPKHLPSIHQRSRAVYVSRETRLKIQEEFLKYRCSVPWIKIKCKGIREAIVSKAKNDPRYPRKWEEKWLTNIHAWWCLSFPPPAEAQDSCLSLNARVQGRKGVTGKYLQCKVETVLFHLKASVWMSVLQRRQN